MKKILLSSLVMLCAMLSNAQYSTTGFSFQGYASDPEGKALGSVGITVKFTLYSGTDVNLVYAEEQNVSTDAYGVFSATVGKGTSVSAETKTPFAALNLNLYKYKLKVEVKKTAGGSYTTISDAELNAVPYARSAENGVPVGTIVAFAGPIANIPAGWVLCNGAVKDGSQEEWKALYAAIGASWGDGADGAGANFNLPDGRGMFLRGVDGGRGLDDNRTVRGAQTAGGNTGDNVGSVQGDATKRPSNNLTGVTSTDGAHAHNYTDPLIGSFEIQSNTGANNRTKEYPTGNGGTTTTQGNHSHSVTINGGGDAETRPENMAVYYIIKK
jgi:microcystin-dependent protein